MNKGPLGFKRLLDVWPMVSSSGGRPEGMIINARIRDNRFLIAERSLILTSTGQTGKDRAALSIPKGIVKPLNFNTNFRLEKEKNDYSEFILYPDNNSEEAFYTSAGNRSSIVINSDNTFKLPFEYPTKVGLDIDLKRPQDGILVRKLEEFEKKRISNVPQDKYLKIIGGQL